MVSIGKAAPKIVHVGGLLFPVEKGTLWHTSYKVPLPQRVYERSGTRTWRMLVSSLIMYRYTQHCKYRKLWCLICKDVCHLIESDNSLSGVMRDALVCAPYSRSPRRHFPS